VTAHLASGRHPATPVVVIGPVAALDLGPAATTAAGEPAGAVHDGPGR